MDLLCDRGCRGLPSHCASSTGAACGCAGCGPSAPRQLRHFWKWSASLTSESPVAWLLAENAWSSARCCCSSRRTSSWQRRMPRSRSRPGTTCRTMLDIFYDHVCNMSDDRSSWHRCCGHLRRASTCEYPTGRTPNGHGRSASSAVLWSRSPSSHRTRRRHGTR